MTLVKKNKLKSVQLIPIDLGVDKWIIINDIDDPSMSKIQEIAMEHGCRWIGAGTRTISYRIEGLIKGGKKAQESYQPNCLTYDDSRGAEDTTRKIRNENIYYGGMAIYKASDVLKYYG